MTDRNQNIVDNLSQVAHDIIDFILKSHPTIREQNKHIAELATIMKDIEDEYNKPILTSWSMLYRVYRQYAADQGIVHTETPCLDDQILILEVITHFFKNGAHDSSSANLILLDLLLDKVNKYVPLENDERLNRVSEINKTILLGIKLALRNAFIQHAKDRLTAFRPQVNADAKVIKLSAVKK